MNRTDSESFSDEPPIDPFDGEYIEAIERGLANFDEISRINLARHVSELRRLDRIIDALQLVQFAPTTPEARDAMTRLARDRAWLAGVIDSIQRANSANRWWIGECLWYIRIFRRRLNRSPWELDEDEGDFIKHLHCLADRSSHADERLLATNPALGGLEVSADAWRNELAGLGVDVPH